MHAYSKYKTHAFPHDELLPLSCRGQGYDRANIGVRFTYASRYSFSFVNRLLFIELGNQRLQRRFLTHSG